MKSFTRTAAPWLAAAAAGIALVLYADPPVDSDNDGMPDAFENFFGLDANSAVDASGNGDTDQHSNLQESARWTDPFASDTDLDGWPDHADTNALSRAVMHWGVAQFTDGDSYDYTGPNWFLGATKFNGAWISNSWDVAATETNAASLNLYLDRVLLTNAVRMAVTLMDRPGAGLEVDLLNTNGTSVATNLVGNLITGGGTELRRKVMVDLPAFPDGVFISLRRSSGHVTVFDTVLYVDDDDDGLDKDQEAQLGTSDLLTDSDGDGFNDGYEQRVGTDPLSGTSKPFGPMTLLLPPDVTVEYGQSTAPTATGTASVETMDGSPATLGYSDQIVDPVTLLPLRNSADWAWRYDMSSAPNNMNLDGTGGDDWWDAAAPTVAGGTANGGAGLLYRGDFNGSIWRSGIGNGNYSLEFLVQLSSTGTEGSMGSIGFFGEKPADAHQGLRLNIKRNGQTASNGATVQYALGDHDNTCAFNRFRIARSAPGRYEIWRNDVRLNTVPVVGGNNANDNGIFLGAFSSNLSGGWQLDDLRLTPGAYAPDTPVGRLLQRTWTAVGAGTSVSAVQRIMIQDTTPPVLYCPPDLTLELAAPTTPDHTGWATASDLLDPAPVVAWSDTHVESGLELFLPLDEDGPPYQDRGGGGSVFAGAGSPVTGRVGRAMSLSGAGAPVSAANLLPTAQSRSISLWFRTTSAAKAMLYSFEGVVFAYLENGRVLPAFDGSSTGDPWWGQGLHDGQWHHLLAMNDGSTTTLLIDGVAVGSRPELSGDLNNYNRTSALGAQYNGQSFRLTGELDEVAVWNRCVDSPEAVLLAAGGESTLVRRTWTATDASGNIGSALQVITRTGLLADTDGDGLINRDEELLGTNPVIADTDADGLTDGVEVNTHHTNPLSGDSDGDRMPDSWEVAAGLNPLVNDADGDLDGDRLSNLDEFTFGTDATQADTDGDEVNDFDEIMLVGSDPLSSEYEGTATDVVVIPGRSILPGAIGVWFVDRSGILCADRRGEASWELNIPQDGWYVVAIDVSQKYTTSPGEKRPDIRVTLDGLSGEIQPCPILPGTVSTHRVLASRISAGTHVFALERLYDEDGNTGLIIERIRVQQLNGPDPDANGRPAWVDQRLVRLLPVPDSPASSLTSPVFMEGQSLDARLLSCATVVDGVTNAIPVHQALEGNYYVNAELSSTNAVTIQISAENRARVVTREIEWSALNLADPPASPIQIRVGDALLLMAAPAGVTNGTSIVTVSGAAPYTVSPVARVVHRFNVTGEYTVTGVCNGVNLGQFTVKVMGASFGPDPVAWFGKTRSWTAPALPSGVKVEADPRLIFTATATNGAARVFNITSDERSDRRVLARLGDNGPVLATTTVHGFRNWSSLETNYFLLQQNPDGSKVISMQIVQERPLTDLTIRLNIFVAGVFFDDGTTVKDLNMNDFDANGMTQVIFHMAPGVNTSYCHLLKAWQGSTFVGQR